MVGRRRHRSRQLASTHQRSWLWGRHAVVELLATDRWRPLELRLADDLDPQLREELVATADAREIPLTFHPVTRLTQWCAARDHQGLLALLPPYPYGELVSVLTKDPAPSLVLVLDRIQDPHNFGALLRSAEVFGVEAVVVGEREQCDVTPHVVRSSAGAVHHLPICRVMDLGEALRELRAIPRLAAIVATAEAAAPIASVDLRTPVALVIGNEGTGVSQTLRAACTQAARIPQVGRLNSLNAAVAAGILLYEVQRQRAIVK